MKILRLASCEIVNIISEGIQDEYTRIKSVYFSDDASIMVDIMQIIYADTDYGRFVARGYNCGKMIFCDNSEDGLAIDLSLAGWQLGDFSDNDTIEITDKGRYILSSIPYLFAETEKLEER